MSNVLVYVGANLGDALSTMVSYYDKVYAFEPIPQIYEKLVSRLGHHSNVEFINAACHGYDGETIFYLSKQVKLVSSSLGQLTPREDIGTIVFDETKVKCINLLNFLRERNITFIDSYISDAQGSDYNILLNIKEYITECKIQKLQIETHGKLNLYQNLENRFIKHEELLSENYKLDVCKVGGRVIDKVAMETELEWDSYWSLIGETITDG